MTAPRAAGPNIQAIIGSIKTLFRQAAKAVAQLADEPQPKPRRRRSGEDTRDTFPAAARKLLRRAARVPQGVYAAASIFMSETLDWLNIWHPDAGHGSAAESGGIFDTKSNPLSPGL